MVLPRMPEGSTYRVSTTARNTNKIVLSVAGAERTEEAEEAVVATLTLKVLLQSHLRI
jgi:hypothetical protein